MRMKRFAYLAAVVITVSACASSQPVVGCGDGPRLSVNGRAGATVAPSQTTAPAQY